MFSLNGPSLRTRRRARLETLRRVAARVEVGFDLACAWPKSRDDAVTPFADRLRREPAVDPVDALWLPVVAELYEAGAPVRDALAGWQAALADAEAADIERFCRERPEKVSLVLLVFYLPAAFLVLFPPMLLLFAESALPSGP